MLNHLILKYLPDCFKTVEMCNEVVKRNPWLLKIFVPDHLKTAEMCQKAVEKDPWMLEYVPDHLKAQ